MLHSVADYGSSNTRLIPTIMSIINIYIVFVAFNVFPLFYPFTSPLFCSFEKICGRHTILH
jgi:hypothetical protein